MTGPPDNARRGPLAAELPVSGPAAPPRSNGELVFHAPWQARLFGLTLGLVEAGQIEWSIFQEELVEQISRDGSRTSSRQLPTDLSPEDADHQRQLQDRYWRHWLGAFESIVGRSLTTGDPDFENRLGRLRDELAARPHGHDH